MCSIQSSRQVAVRLSGEHFRFQHFDSFHMTNTHASSVTDRMPWSPCVYSPRAQTELLHAELMHWESTPLPSHTARHALASSVCHCTVQAARSSASSAAVNVRICWNSLKLAKLFECAALCLVRASENKFFLSKVNRARCEQFSLALFCVHLSLCFFRIRLLPAYVCSVSGRAGPFDSSQR